MEKLKEKIKNLLEKFKSLDKKIQIASIAGVVVVIAAIIIVLVLCLGGKDKDDKKDKDDTYTKDKIEKEEDKEDDSEEETEDVEATFTVKVVDAEGNAVAGVELKLAKEESISATTDDTGVATFNVEITEGYKLSVVTCPEGYEYTGEAEVALEAGIKEYTVTIQKKQEDETSNETTGNSSSGSGQTATQLETTTKDDGTEILGAGSASQPYLETPNLDNMTLTTVSVPAGKTLYYGIYRVGGMILTINNANAYVIDSNGTRHDASGGKVTFTVEDALASDAVMFQIGNKGGSATAFTIQFTNPTGSYENPSAVNMSGNITVNLAEGDSDGHWYKYIAERSGKIRFYLLTSPDSNGLVAQNNSGTATIQRTIEADGEVDSQGTYVELEVNQGDEILINVAAKPNKRGKYPATTLTWCAKYN